MGQNYFVCDGCGYIGKGETPVKCPVCSAEGQRFKQVDKKIFEVAAKAEGGLETDVAYDDVPMQWTKDAKEAIRAVPAGFQRRRAKARIEKSARKLGMTTITLEYSAPMIKEAAAEDYTPIFSNKGTGTSPVAETTLAARRMRMVRTVMSKPRHPTPGLKKHKPGWIELRKASCAIARERSFSNMLKKSERP